MLALIVATQALSLGFACPVAVAAEVAGDLMKDGVDLYKQHKYSDAIKVFEDRLSQDPNDAAAHYYVGNCWAGLGRLDMADQSYEQCLKLKPSAYIGFYAGRMHTEIQKRLASSGNQANAASAQPTQRHSDDQRKFEASVSELKQRLRQRQRDEANSKIDCLQAQIDRARNEYKQSVAYEPPTFFSRRGRTIQNPYVFNAKNFTTGKIVELEKEISKIRRDLRKALERSDSQIDNTFAELSSQARGTKGSIKPLLTSRSIYVRDYVHFTGDEPPPDYMIIPLKAVPGKYAGPSKP